MEIKEIFTLDYTCGQRSMYNKKKSSKNHSQKFVVHQSLQLYNYKSCRSI